jgi:uncharacterized membrane protein
LLVHGAFLAVTARFLLPRVDPGGRDRAIAAALVVAVAGLASTVGLLAVVPFVLVVLAGWLLLRSDATVEPSGWIPVRADGDAGYETALAVAAVGVVVLAEFVYVGGRGNPTRYNTVFKTYADVWILWGVASAAMLAAYADPAGFLARVRDRIRGAAGDGGPAVSAGGVLAAVLVVSLSLYGGFALANHVGASDRHGPASLDALGFVERNHATEAGAIEFVRGLDGQPNIVTAPTLGGDMYDWSSDFEVRRGDGRLVGGSAPASLTGVPTLLGWFHEVGYRGQAAWEFRLEDVRTIYDGTPVEQVRHLEGYRVEYVYVGPTERQRYDNWNLGERLTGVGVAYEDEYVTVYRVTEDLGVAEGSGTGGN